jgi:hypothetical protein
VVLQGCQMQQQQQCVAKSGRSLLLRQPLNVQ